MATTGLDLLGIGAASQNLSDNGVKVNVTINLDAQTLVKLFFVGVSVGFLLIIASVTIRKLAKSYS